MCNQEHWQLANQWVTSRCPRRIGPGMSEPRSSAAILQHGQQRACVAGAVAVTWAAPHSSAGAGDCPTAAWTTNLPVSALTVGDVQGPVPSRCPAVPLSEFGIIPPKNDSLTLWSVYHERGAGIPLPSAVPTENDSPWLTCHGDPEEVVFVLAEFPGVLQKAAPLCGWPRATGGAEPGARRQRGAGRRRQELRARGDSGGLLHRPVRLLGSHWGGPELPRRGHLRGAGQKPRWMVVCPSRQRAVGLQTGIHPCELCGTRREHQRWAVSIVILFFSRSVTVTAYCDSGHVRKVGRDNSEVIHELPVSRVRGETLWHVRAGHHFSPLCGAGVFRLGLSWLMFPWEGQASRLIICREGRPQKHKIINGALEKPMADICNWRII